ncbi:MAG: M23 family metallopeptidase [Clostridia bacterium]
MFKKFYCIAFILTILISFISSSKETVTDNSKLLYPTTTKYITSYFGYRDLFGTTNFHNGIDFGAAQGSKVFATLSGTITSASFTKGYGNCITTLHSNGTKSLYGHLSDNFIVKTGQHVNKGDVISFVGPKYLSNGILNGWTTGPHLHFSIFSKDGTALDPLTFEFE